MIAHNSQLLKLGLQYAGYLWPNKCKIETNVAHFAKNFGVHPLTAEKLWLDMKNTPNEDAGIPDDTNPMFILVGLRHLWKYESIEQLACFFNMSKRSMRKFYDKSVLSISLLFQEVVPPIENYDYNTIFMLSIDRTHCPIEEPKPWDSKWLRHKVGNKAGLAYEVGLNIHIAELAWVHGPLPAETGDLDIFRYKLKEKIQTLNSNLIVKKRVSSANLVYMYMYVCMYIIATTLRFILLPNFVTYQLLRLLHARATQVNKT